MAAVNYYDVILKPVITEKSMAGMGDKKYTFLVHPEANKTMITQRLQNLRSKKLLKKCSKEPRLRR